MLFNSFAYTDLCMKVDLHGKTEKKPTFFVLLGIIVA